MNISSSLGSLGPGFFYVLGFLWLIDGKMKNEAFQQGSVQRDLFLCWSDIPGTCSNLDTGTTDLYNNIPTVCSVFQEDSSSVLAAAAP